MPPTPLVPSFRVSFPYTVTGFPHVMHFFLDVIASADPSGWSAVVRAPLVNAGISAIFVAMWTNLAAMYNPANTQFGNAHLDNLVAGAWVPLWTEANAIVASSGGTETYAHLWTWSGYSTIHEKMKVAILEDVFAGASKFIAPSGNASLDELTDSFFNAQGGAVKEDPWAWARSRNNDFVGAFTSVVGAYSKHWRRKRGIG